MKYLTILAIVLVTLAVCSAAPPAVPNTDLLRRVTALEKAQAEVVKAIHQRDKFDEERRIEFLKDGIEYKKTTNKFITEIGDDLIALTKRVKALEQK